MFRCPSTGSRLIKARAGGGTIWYSPGSDGRMLTLGTARHFFGEDRVREIWMQSDRVEADSPTRCPSCTQNMRLLNSLPDWVGSGAIDVCRRCRVFWIEPENFPQVPRGSQLLSRAGDSTLVSDLGSAYLEHKKIQHEHEVQKQDGFVDRPESTVEFILTFLRLPVERSNRPAPQWPILSGLTLAFMLVFYAFFTDSEIIQNFGFYPGEFLKNYGFNIFSSVFIHASWMHLLVNCYFAYLFSDDVEDDLGPGRFILFLLFVPLFIAASLFIFSGSKMSPHVGYSGVIMALLTYYALQFPGAKMIWMLPRLNNLKIGRASSLFVGWGWFQIRPLWVAAIYLVWDLVLYFALERNHLSAVSSSGHIAGILAGGLFWLMFATKEFHAKLPDRFEQHLDTLVRDTNPVVSNLEVPTVKQLKSSRDE